MTPAAQARFGTSLQLRVSEEEMSAEQVETYKMVDRWAEIRHYSDEKAEAELEGEELEAYTRYHAGVKEDIEKMKIIAGMMAKSVEIDQIAPKSKTQRKKDKWAIIQKREAARAAMK